MCSLACYMMLFFSFCRAMMSRGSRKLLLGVAQDGDVAGRREVCEAVLHVLRELPTAFQELGDPIRSLLEEDLPGRAVLHLKLCRLVVRGAGEGVCRARRGLQEVEHRVGVVAEEGLARGLGGSVAVDVYVVLERGGLAREEGRWAVPTGCSGGGCCRCHPVVVDAVFVAVWGNGRGRRRLAEGDEATVGVVSSRRPSWSSSRPARGTRKSWSADGGFYGASHGVKDAAVVQQQA